MSRLSVAFLAASLLVCPACQLNPLGSSKASPKPVQSPTTSDTGSVSVSEPSGRLTLSSVHFVAKALSTCAKGISGMGIYTAADQLAFSVNGSKLDKTLVLPPGTYQAEIQASDNCGGKSKALIPVTVQSASTTLGTETANNTPASDRFPAQSNGNAASSNVSKLDLHTLLYPGSTTQIYAEIQPWFGDNRHMNVGYISWDRAQIQRQMEDMISRGITGVVIDWYGPADPTEKTTLAWIAAAETHPDFKVMIMIDKGAINLSPCDGCKPQDTLIYLTNYVLQHYAGSPAYTMLNGQPVITQFDLDYHFNFNWEQIQSALSSQVVWIFENSDGFAHPASGGSWAWMNATSKQYGIDYLTSFYNAAAKHPEKMAWGAGYKGFNDTLASWSLNRVVGQQCGQTWLQTFDMINRYYNSGNQLPILQLVTWNDYEEGTEIESGIDNCLTVTASVGHNNLQWAINGKENTVDHYTIYYSVDGQNLLTLGTVPAGTHYFDISSFSLAQGYLFVQAVGKPMIRNQMSRSVAFAP